MNRTWRWLITVLTCAVAASAASCDGGESSSPTGGGGTTTTAPAGGSGGGGGTAGHGGGTAGNGGTGPMCDPALCPAPESECMMANCEDNGCSEKAKPDGTVPGTQIAGDCQKRVCQGGAAVDETDDTDLPDDRNECTDDLCEDGVPSHPALAKDSPCGADGTSFCDGAGICAECTSPTQCMGQDTECQVRTCDLGVCGIMFTAQGTALAAQTMGNCQVDQCDGAGGVETVAADMDIEDDGNACTDDSCDMGVIVHSSTAIQTPCGAGLKCDGDGMCVGCIDTTDCPPSGNACIVLTCIGGMCGTANEVDGTTCDDGNACTQTDTCQAGACTGANPVICTALDQCHDPGMCDPATGVCSNPDKANGTACSDGNACTQTDTCQAGACAGANPVVCTALDQCHDAGTCNTTTGVCSNPNKANGSACSDGNACTQTDTCQAGACTGANPVVCTPLDTCHNAGTCNTTTGVCSNPNKANGTACNDGNACTQTDTCQAGTCTGANPVVCTALDQCHNAGTCNMATGACSNPNKANGTACNDGNACTQTDTCQAGACTGANPVVCTPLDTCHNAGICNTTTGVCSNPNKANGAACDDGNACTQTDTCFSGTCVGANPVTCMALDQCHNAGTCSMATGVCSNPNKANGTACTSGGQSGTCQMGACAVCGNGTVEGNETCDDMNAVPCDGCSPKCQLDTTITYSAGPGLNVTWTDDGYNGTQASMGCANVTVTAAGDGTVDYVCPTVGMSSTWVGDLTIKLISPANTVVTLMSRPGVLEVADDGQGTTGDSSNLVFGFPITWIDGGPKSAEAMGNTLANAGNVCQNDMACVYDPNNGAAAAGKLAAFIGQNAAGTWKLCVGDSGLGDIGAIDQVKLVIGQ